MRKLILFCTLCLPSFILFGQSLPVDRNGKITYTEVVILKDSISKSELYKRAKNCLVRLFRDANSVIQNDDKENGSIDGKGNIKVFAKALGSNVESGQVNFLLNISVKDGKYKYTISDLIHEGNGRNIPSAGRIENGKPKAWLQKQWNYIITQTDDGMKNLILSLKTEMNKPLTENW